MTPRTASLLHVATHLLVFGGAGFATVPGEAANLAARMIERTRILRRQLDAWRREVGAQSPVPNAAELRR